MQFLQDIVIREKFPEMSALASLDERGQIKRNQPVTQLEVELLTAPSLYSGLQSFCSQYTRYWSRLRFWLRETERHVWFCSLLPVSAFERGREQQVQSRIIRIIGLIEQYLGFRWRPDALVLECALPSRLMVEAMDSPRVIVNAGYSAVPIPTRLLANSGPLDRSDGRTCGNDGTRDEWNWMQSLRAVMPEYVVDKQPSIAQIADLAHVSGRTLQRELASQGTSFRELLDSARFVVARRKLAQPDLKIEEIGSMLGYTQPTHFSRAFRRFAGQTPSQYRAQLQGQG
jgi:AraC-like DNA-binding protein